MNLENKQIRVVPKFANPIAHDYAEVVLKKYFPTTTCMCGAGDEFFYINNKGELYPCDRARETINEKIPKENRLLVKKDFWEVASHPLYGEIFGESENIETYSEYTPCNRCEYLQKKCYPCVMRKKTTEVKTCTIMFEEIDNEKNRIAN